MTKSEGIEPSPLAPASGQGVPLREAIAVWARIALSSFGGPAGQIAMMHRVLVEEKRWVGETRFLQALNYCMLLPGPEAQQLATYLGWLLHKTRGGLIAGILFILPGAAAIMALSLIYASFGHVGAVQGLFFGLKAAVLAIVLQAVLRLGQRTLKNTPTRAIAAAAFVAIFFLDLPFPLIVLGAGLIGFLGARRNVAAFRAGQAQTEAPSALGEATPDHAKPSLTSSLKTASLCLILWLAPVALLVALRGRGDIYSQIGVFFSKMAVVGFGGAYAVLAYVAQAAVETYGWLRPGEMLDGLGMAETTPGPLIMVVQFVGFMGGYRHPGALPPLLAGAFAGALTTWVTFAPCFLWIFVGGPFIEKLRANKALGGALIAITAAVVGVILNLAIWFALHTLFGEIDRLDVAGLRLQLPVLQTLNLASLALTASAMLAVFKFKLDMLPTLGLCALGGLLLHLAGAA
ncbi:chromate efflux transporter [Methylocapsa aurea]|uniref:chromate efflux transporter n=1 Tax=Methylocapsa aurea TaxID=663610 RepID=UPI000689292A|nr:chromate efflux transporter [Methylocapsa aurea]